MTLGFLSGSRNCASFSGFLGFCFLHRYDWIAYQWLFWDSQMSFRTLWSAVIKSPKFSAPGTASPLRLLHGALVILVRLEISQFRSLGKWVWTLCLPKSSRLFVVGSKDASWEELAWEPPCNVISSTKVLPQFLQPFRNLRIVRTQRVTSFYRGFLFICFLVFFWLGFHPQVALSYHQPNQTLALDEMSLLVDEWNDKTMETQTTNKLHCILNFQQEVWRWPQSIVSLELPWHCDMLDLINHKQLCCWSVLWNQRRDEPQWWQRDLTWNQSFQREIVESHPI